MATTCCGEERATPFCPQCGKQLMEDPIIEILNYLRHCLNAHKTRLKTAIRSQDGNHPGDDPERIKKTIAKWERWVGSLAAVVKERNHE